MKAVGNLEQDNGIKIAGKEDDIFSGVVRSVFGLYLIGQKISIGSSIICYRKIKTNFSAKPIYCCHLFCRNLGGLPGFCIPGKSVPQLLQIMYYALFLKVQWKKIKSKTYFVIHQLFLYLNEIIKIPAIWLLLFFSPVLVFSFSLP